MKRIKVEIIRLGESKHDYTIKKLKQYQDSKKSKLFEITEIKKVNLPDSDSFSWGYTDKTLLSIITKSKTNADIQLGIIDYPLEGNYFGRELSDKIGVISLYETDMIFKNSNLDLINFLLLTIYQTVVLFACHKSISDSHGKFHHDETRGCIFDMCGIKQNIVMSASNPIVCYLCEAKMRECTLNDEFIVTLKKEIQIIKNPLYYRIIDWIKNHLIWSLIITVISTILLNIISNAIFSLILNIMNKK